MCEASEELEREERRERSWSVRVCDGIGPILDFEWRRAVIVRLSF